MRQAIKALEEGIASLKAIHSKKVQEYINSTKGDLLYITDHAKVRYLERKEKFTLVGDTDQEKLASVSVFNLREKMLTREDQEKILLQDITEYRKEGMRFIISNLTVITVTNL